MKTICTLIISSILFWACSGAKKYYKQGLKYEESGMIEMAADMYLNALKAKPTFIEARIKLKDIGQKHITRLSSSFFKNYSTQDYESCLENFVKLKAYCEQSQSLEISLDYPKSYNDDFNNALELFSEDQYGRSKQWLQKKRYNEALQHIQKIRKYNPDYKNTQELYVMASCEPSYQSAIQTISQKNYSSAYQSLNTIRGITQSYKDYTDLWELTTLKLKKRILFLPRFTKGSSNWELELNQLLSSLQNPGIEIISEPAVLKPAAQIELHQNVLAQALGASHVVLFTVTEISQNTVGPRRTSYTAYQEYRYKKNDQVYTDYKSVPYFNVRGERYVQYKFQYSIFDKRQNRITESKSELVKISDVIEYNEFDGKYQDNLNSLFRNRPNGSFVIGEGAWRNLFSARNRFMSYEELKQQAFEKNKSIMSSIINRLP